MSSFSDAHECLEIPIIAANMHRMMMPRQSQIWAVIRKDADISDIYYRISAAMLEGLHFYHKVSPVIDKGVTEIVGPHILSYRNPEGWQAVIRKEAPQQDRILIVFHTFGKAPEKLEVTVSEETADKTYIIEDSFMPPGIRTAISGNRMVVEGTQDFQGGAILCRQKGK